MIVMALANELKTLFPDHSVFVVGEKQAVNIGYNDTNRPFMLIGEADSSENDSLDSFLIQVYYPAGYMYQLEQCVVYDLYELLDKRLVQVANLSKTVTYEVQLIVDLGYTGVVYAGSSKEWISRSRLVSIPKLQG